MLATEDGPLVARFFLISFISPLESLPPNVLLDHRTLSICLFFATTLSAQDFLVELDFLEADFLTSVVVFELGDREERVDLVDVPDDLVDLVDLVDLDFLVEPVVVFCSSLFSSAMFILPCSSATLLQPFQIAQQRILLLLLCEMFLIVQR